MPHNQGDIVRSWCNSCCRETEHDVTHVEVTSATEDPENAVDTRSVVVRCRGCKEYSIRNEIWYTDLVPNELNQGTTLSDVTFIPPRLWRRSPDWLQQLEEVEPDLNDILKETYLAMNDSQVRLLAMAVRTALDYVMTKIVGDVGNFSEKLSRMVQDSHLSTRQAEMLDTVIDAGSAAAHRGFKPPRELLQEMVTTMETIIRDHYLTGPMLKDMKKLVPPRPARRRP